MSCPEIVDLYPFMVALPRYMTISERLGLRRALGQFRAPDHRLKADLEQAIAIYELLDLCWDKYIRYEYVVLCIQIFSNKNRDAFKFAVDQLLDTKLSRLIGHVNALHFSKVEHFWRLFVFQEAATVQSLLKSSDSILTNLAIYTKSVSEALNLDKRFIKAVLSSDYCTFIASKYDDTDAKLLGCNFGNIRDITKDVTKRYRGDQVTKSYKKLMKIV